MITSQSPSLRSVFQYTDNYTTDETFPGKRSGGKSLSIAWIATVHREADKDCLGALGHKGWDRALRHSLNRIVGGCSNIFGWPRYFQQHEAIGIFQRERVVSNVVNLVGWADFKTARGFRGFQILCGQC